MKYSYYENLINNAETVEEADHIITCIECDQDITDEDFEKSIAYAEKVMDELEREHKWEREEEEWEDENSHGWTDYDKMREVGMTERDFM